MTKKKIDLEKIPELLEKAAALIDREIKVMGDKEQLSSEDARNLIAYITALSSVYKEYRAEIKQIKEDLRGKTKEELMEMMRTG